MRAILRRILRRWRLRRRPAPPAWHPFGERGIYWRDLNPDERRARLDDQRAEHEAHRSWLRPRAR